MTLWITAAWASGVLFDTTSYAPLESLEVMVQIEGRVASGTSLWRFSQPSPSQTGFAAALPEDAAVVGLRALVDGEWVLTAAQDAEAQALLTAPDDLSLLGPRRLLTRVPEGSTEVALDWQLLLLRVQDRLALSVPLSDAGLSPGQPTASLSWELYDALGVEQIELEPQGDLQVGSVRASGSWQGSLDRAPWALSWRVAPEPFGVTVMSYRPEIDPFTAEPNPAGYGLALLTPGPLDPDQRVDQLFSFVVDVSESMRGAPLQAATRAGVAWVGSLQPSDRFNLVPYSSQALPFRARAPHAEGRALDRARRFLQRQQAQGLSDPAEGLVTALELSADSVLQRTFFGCGGSARQGSEGPTRDAEIQPTDDVRVAPYLVLITDGGASSGLTDPDRIVDAVAQANSVGASVFTLGVGPEVDAPLLRRLADAHRGSYGHASSVEQVDEVVQRLRARISDPLLVRPQVSLPQGFDWAPRALADVTAGHEVLVAFRYDDPGPSELRLTGVRGQQDYDQRWPVVLPEAAPQLPAVAQAWAQLRVRDLEAQIAAGDGGYDELFGLVEDYGVASDLVVLGFPAISAEASSDVGAGAACGCVSAWAVAGWLPLGLALSLALARRRAANAGSASRRSWEGGRGRPVARSG